MTDKSDDTVPRLPWQPADPGESADLFDIMRALIAGMLLSRKAYRIRQPARIRMPAHGLLVRVTLDREGTIEAWLEPRETQLRHGVPYVRSEAPLPELVAE